MSFDLRSTQSVGPRGGRRQITPDTRQGCSFARFAKEIHAAKAQPLHRLRHGSYSFLLVVISMRVPNLAPVSSWILEWGPHARAVAPSELVAQIKAELDEARAQYT